MKIPHSRPCFDAHDRTSLIQLLHGNFISSGKKAEYLGLRIAGLLGKKWGIATQSGTDAITASLRLLGLRKNEKVTVPAYICSAPLDALALLGLIPEPLDIEKETLAINPELANENRKNRAVIAAHLFGIPAPLHKITEKNFIEDCAQTLCIDCDGHLTGSSGCLSVCSFYATKLVTSGHGGAIAGNKPELFRNAMDLFSHDKREKWMPHMHFLMSDLNASLGLSQLKKIGKFIAARKTIARRFVFSLTGKTKIAHSVYSRFLVAALNEKADEHIKKFRHAGIEAKRPVFKPLYKYLGLDDKKFPNAKWAHDHIISIPIYPGMAESDIAYIEKFLRKFKHDLRCWPPA